MPTPYKGRQGVCIKFASWWGKGIAGDDTKHNLEEADLPIEMRSFHFTSRAKSKPRIFAVEDGDGCVLPLNNG